MKNFKFKINGNEYNVEIKDFEDQNAQIEVNGTVYNVELEKEVKASEPTPKIVKKQAAAPSTAKPTTTGAASNIKSPLPGVILEIHVKEGASVKRGEKLLTMEAMKMHNAVNAEKDGVIKSIKISEGQSVMEGDVLIEVE